MLLGKQALVSQESNSVLNLVSSVTTADDSLLTTRYLSQLGEKRRKHVLPVGGRETCHPTKISV